MKLHRSALRLAFVYWICASLWTVFSDQLLFKLFGPSERMVYWHSAKDLGVVLLTSALLYALLNLYFSRMSLQHTTRRANEASLRQAAAVFDSTLEGVLVTDTQQKIIHVNRAFQRITGYEEKEVLGKLPSMFQSGRHDDAFYQVMWKGLNQRGEWSGEIWNRRKSGEIFPIWQNLRAIHDENGELSHYVAVFSDITAIKRSQNELDHLAHHDPLTSLPNRLLFIERVESALKRIFADKRGGAVMVVDLDHFKHINESLGHNIGDQLLKAVAERLRELLEDGMTLARMGGDEFALIYEDCPHVEQAAALATRILEEIKAPFSLGGHELFTGASIGISLYPSDARTVQQLLRNADSALFKAKSSGREGYAFYTQELTAYAHQRVELATSLRHALEGGQLRVFYQPVLRLTDGHIVGVEALVRVRRGEHFQPRVQPWRPARPRRRDAGEGRPGAGLAGAGSHRKRDHARPGRCSRTAGAPARARRAAVHRRLRHRLFVAAAAQAPAGAQAEDRPGLRRRPARRKRGHGHHPRGDRPGQQPRPEGARRGHRDPGTGRLPPRTPVRSGPGLLVRSSAAGRQDRLARPPARQRGMKKASLGSP